MPSIGPMELIIDVRRRRRRRARLTSAGVMRQRIRNDG
jgi:hypothetical protein